MDNVTISQAPEILEIDKIDLDFKNVYCIFLPSYEDKDILELTLLDHKAKEELKVVYKLKWHEDLKAMMIVDLNFRTTQLVASELVFQGIEFFTKKIPSYEYNKLAVELDTPVRHPVGYA